MPTSSAIRSAPLLLALALAASLAACGAPGRVSETAPGAAAAPWAEGEVARVLGQPVTDDAPDEAWTAGASRILFQNAARRRGLTPSDAQVAECDEGVRRMMTTVGAPAPPPDDESMKLAADFALLARVDAALYEEYGGAVIFTLLPPQTPAGAYRRYFESCAASGDLVFRDEVAAREFWSVFAEPPESDRVPKAEVAVGIRWWAGERAPASAPVCRPQE